MVISMQDAFDTSATVGKTAAGEQPNLRPPFVVLVDDDREIAEMYRLGLEAAGFRVKLESRPSAFLEAVASEVPDAVVLDWNMPGMYGDQVLEELRKAPATAGLPVFLLSSYLGDHDGAIDRVFALGALAWLRKSVTAPDVLARRLTQAIARTRHGRRADDHV